MPQRCITCLPNKKKIFFDIEKARTQAKKSAIENEKTFAIYKEGNAVSFTDADTARAGQYAVIEFVSQYNL